MKTGIHDYILIELVTLVCLGLGEMARAQGTYYDAPSTPIDITQFGFGGDPSYTNYAHDTRLWIPNDVTVIRGVIVLANGAGGDQRGRTAELDWQALARAHGFALMGTHGYVCYGNGTTSVDTEVPVLLGDLAWYATASGHPEVANLPFILGGWSGGGQIAYGINTKIPERVIAFITNKGAYYIQNPLVAAALKTPSIGVAGALDSVAGRTAIKNNFESNRPLGARWADAFEENTGHAEGKVNGVFFTFFDHAIRARYPAGVTPLSGPVTLTDLVETNGWLATEPTDTKGLYGKVYPYADYPGPSAKTNACWLMDADVANLYRSFATYAPAVTVSNVAGPVYSPDQTIQFNVTVDSNALPGWTTADVFDGAFKMGTVTNGQSLSIYAKRPWGGRGVTAIAYNASTNATSIPQYFVVSNPVALSNQAATSVLSTNATLNASFSPSWGSYDVRVCWGTVNGGANAANWANSALVGPCAADGYTTNISYTASGLSIGTAYYFTFFASNAVKQVWATNVLSFTTGVGNVAAGDGAWNQDASGNWSVNGNWFGTPSSVPGGAGSTVWLANNISAARTVTADSSRIGGTLNMGSGSGSNAFILAASGGATLTFDNSGANAQLNERSTSKGDTISAPVQLNSSLDIANASVNTLTVSGTITNTSGSAVTLRNQGTGTGDVAISGIIMNSGAPLAVTQNSASSKLILTATNTYSGATTINVGSLVGVVGGSCTNSAVSVAATAGNTAILNISVTNTTKQWSCKSLSVNNAGTASVLSFDFGMSLTPSTTVAPLKVIGAVIFTTTSTVIVNVGSTMLGPIGTVYPLMTCTSTNGFVPTAVTVTTVSRPVAAHLTVTGTAPFTLNLVIDSNPQIRWATSTAGAWDLSAANWKDSLEAATAYIESDYVIFDEKYISAPTAVTLSGAFSPGSVTVSNTAYSYILGGSGRIAGSASLTKSGSGAFTLNTVNTYSGGTTINGGTLTVGGSGKLGNGLYAGAIVNKATLVYASDQAQTFSGVISDVGALTVQGNGNLMLTGINTYSGATTINAGGLVGVVGGSCTNSAVVVAATAGNTATLNISVPDITKQWRCKSLTVNNAGVASILHFDFAGAVPSTTMAPLKVDGMATFTTPPTIRVARGIPVGTYPLMTCTNTISVPTAVIAPGASARLTLTSSVPLYTLNLVIDSTVAVGFTGGSYDGYDRCSVTNSVIPKQKSTVLMIL